MQLIHLNASAWLTPEDFYSALLPQLGAPDWHGRNLDALNDSLYGGINLVDPPFQVLIEGTRALGPDMKAFLAQVADVFADARKEDGHDVGLKLI